MFNIRIGILSSKRFLQQKSFSKSPLFVKYNVRQINNLRTPLTSAIKSLIHKRFATFNQLSYGRSASYRKPNYNNFKNNISSPLVFTVLFSLGTYFAVPYIFEYTPLSYFRHHPQSLIYGLIGLNVAVFGLWHIRYSNTKIYRILENYFLMDRSSLTRVSNWSMVGSTFSHQDPFHILVNMGCLYSFSGTMVSVLGVEGFTSLYLIAGVWSSYSSMVYSYLFKYYGSSLGASGAISAIFGSFSVLFPSAGIAFFFLPIPGGAITAAALFAVYNVAGCIFRWGSFDYAAHLGGLSVGAAYGLFIKYKIEKEEAERRRRLKSFGYF